MRLLTGKLFLPLEFCSFTRGLCCISLLQQTFRRARPFSSQVLVRSVYSESIKEIAPFGSTRLKVLSLRFLHFTERSKKSTVFRYCDSITCRSLVMWMKKILRRFSHWEVILPSLIEIHSFIMGCEELFFC